MYLRWVSLNFGTLFHHLFCNLPTKENKNKNLSCDLLNRNWDFTRTICSQQINVYLPNRIRTWYSYLIIHLYLKRLPLKKRLLLDTVRTWLDFSNLCENCDLHDLWNSDSHYAPFRTLCVAGLVTHLKKAWFSTPHFHRCLQASGVGAKYVSMIFLSCNMSSDTVYTTFNTT